MARVYTVKKARKDQGNCRTCGKPILAGMGYKYKEPRYGAVIKVHTDCQMKHWYGSSSKMVAIWEALDSFSTDGSLGDIASDLEQLVETAREVGEEYQEGADNQREYFPDSAIADENEERAQNLEQWADELENAASEVNSAAEEVIELEGEKADLESEQNEIEDDSSDRAEEIRKRLEEIEDEVEQKRDDAQSTADDAVSSCPE